MTPADWPPDELAARRSLGKPPGAVGIATDLLAMGYKPGVVMEALYDLWRRGVITGPDLAKGMDACAR